MELKKENLVIFKHFTGAEIAGLEESFIRAADGTAETAFRLGVRMYNMTPGISDALARDIARAQAVGLIGDAAARGNRTACQMLFDLARNADKAATDVLESMNQCGAVGGGHLLDLSKLYERMRTDLGNLVIKDDPELIQKAVEKFGFPSI